MKRCINTHDNANKNNIHNLTGGKLKYRRCQVSKNIYLPAGRISEWFGHYEKCSFFIHGNSIIH